MLFISHRGNLNGPIPERENSPSYIEEAIAESFIVETDLKVIDDYPILGHGEQHHKVSWYWLINRAHNLLLHLKNADAVRYISPDNRFHFFCNDKDEFSLTSKGYILCWSKLPYRKGWHDNYMIPLMTLKDIEQDVLCPGAIISDYPIKCKEKFG